jgi:hypothetical protein
MDQEVQLKMASAARDAANALTIGMKAFDRFVSLLERVEKFAMARWEEEYKKKSR